MREFLRSKIFFGCAVLIGLGLIFVLTPKRADDSGMETPSVQPKSSDDAMLFVVAHPFDLDQIERVTKYRSCFGHNYSGRTVDGEIEDNRSLKHYVTPLESVVQSGKEIPVYAPFDGEISGISSEEDFGYDIWLTPNPGSLRQWQFLFFHIVPADGLEEGSEIRAGQKIGRVQLTPGGNFDIGVKYTSPFSEPSFDIPLKHFSPAILADYEAKRMTLDSSVISKAHRDQNPCPIVPGTEGRNARFPSEAAEGETLFLRH